MAAICLGLNVLKRWTVVIYDVHTPGTFLIIQFNFIYKAQIMFYKD